MAYARPMSVQNKSRQLTVVAIAAASIGIGLLLINLAGLWFLSLRAPGVTEYRDFAGTETLPYRQALQQLDAMNQPDDLASLTEITRIFHLGLAHIDPADRALVGLGELRMTIPVWENYLLFALAYLKPDTYRDYEFCNYRRALERGVGRCGQQSLALVDFLSQRGVDTGFVNLGGHTLVTANTEATGWLLLDPDYGAAIPFDLETAERAPAEVIPYYWNDQVLKRRLFTLFGAEKNEIRYGGPSARWGRACSIESWAYFLKWLLPLLLLLPGGILWLRAQRS